MRGIGIISASAKMERKRRSADKSCLRKHRERLQTPEQVQRRRSYRFEVQHLKVSSLTLPRQAANASVTGSKDLIFCASAIINGIV